jgi:hypothetical protein
MQRMRETSRGLQFTQETDVVTFAADGRGDLRVHLKESSLREKDDRRLFVVEGRDNMRDFGEWLTRLSAEDSSETSTPSSFDTHKIDDYKWVAAISTATSERGAGLAEFLNSEGGNLGTDTIEDLGSVINSLREAIGTSSKSKTRVELEAFAYPFGIPLGMTPVMLATQTYDNLQLQLDELFIHDSVPFESAKQLGAWSLQGLAEIQKKSIWS